jgi:hypothetical protein
MAEHDDVGRSESTQTGSKPLKAYIAQELDEMTDAELAKAMEDHVRKRGEPNFNGAWAMMLEASERLDRWHAWAARYYERCEEAAPDEYESIRSEVIEICRPYAEPTDT